MKKLYLILFVFAVPVVLTLLANSNGSPGGRSGSPGDNSNTCTGCHSGTATSKFGWIATNIPVGGYTPGQTYTITATGTHTGVVKFGFELTVEDNQGNKVGTLQLADPSRTKFTNGNHAVTHTSAGNVPSGNSNSWTMNWVAPSGIDGQVGIYAAFNAANGNGNTTGDVIYKSSTFVSEYVPQVVLTSMTPDQAEQGTTFLATITGSNTEFSGTSAVNLSFSDNALEVVPGTNVVVVNPTVIQAEFTLPVSASAGLWDLSVGDLKLENAFTVLLFTGLDENHLSQLNIYPNPANDKFFIDDAKGSQVSIFRSNGQLVVSQMVDNEKQSVNISNLESGIYLLKINFKGKSETRKLIVN